MKLDNGKIFIVENNIEYFKFKVRIEGDYNGTAFVLNIKWNPGYNTPEEVLELAKQLIG